MINAYIVQKYRPVFVEGWKQHGHSLPEAIVNGVDDWSRELRRIQKSEKLCHIWIFIQIERC